MLHGHISTNMFLSGNLLVLLTILPIISAVQLSECDRSSPSTAYDFRWKMIDEKTPVNLRDFAGSVLLITNVATY